MALSIEDKSEIASLLAASLGEYDTKRKAEEATAKTKADKEKADREAADKVTKDAKEKADKEAVEKAAKDAKDSGLSAEANERIARAEKIAADAKKAADTSEQARKDADAARLKTEADAALRTELSKFEFTSDEAMNDAFILTQGQIERDADGNLVSKGDTPLPLSAFVAKYIPETKAHLLAATGKGGSGTNGGKARVSTKTDINSIKPGMTLEEQKGAARDIASVLKAQQSGQA